jgi:hypothetical protein
MSVLERQRAVQLYRGQIPSPGRPTVAWRQDRVRFWAAIAAGAMVTLKTVGRPLAFVVGVCHLCHNDVPKRDVCRIARTHSAHRETRWLQSFHEAGNDRRSGVGSHPCRAGQRDQQIAATRPPIVTEEVRSGGVEILLIPRRYADVVRGSDSPNVTRSHILTLQSGHDEDVHMCHRDSRHSERNLPSQSSGTDEPQESGANHPETLTSCAGRQAAETSFTGSPARPIDRVVHTRTTASERAFGSARDNLWADKI